MNSSSKSISQATLPETPLIKKTIQANIPKTIQILDSANSTSSYLHSYLNETMLLSDIKSNKDRIIITDKSEHFQKFTNRDFEKSKPNISMTQVL